MVWVRLVRVGMVEGDAGGGWDWWRVGLVRVRLVEGGAGGGWG